MKVRVAHQKPLASSWQLGSFRLEITSSHDVWFFSLWDSCGNKLGGWVCPHRRGLLLELCEFFDAVVDEQSRKATATARFLERIVGRLRWAATSRAIDEAVAAGRVR